MALLPEGTSAPPLPLAAVLVAAAAVVGALLARDRPRIDDRTVLALAPWMVLGAVLYVAYQLGLVPEAVAPLTSSPTVYATTAVLAGAVWLLARRFAAIPRAALASAGSMGVVFVAALAVGYGVRRGSLSLVWPVVALGTATVLAALLWAVMSRVASDTTATMGGAGVLVVFAHALDGVSTAVGYDVLGFGERSPLSRAVIEFSAGLPTAELLGAGWLFVALKLTLASLALWLLAGYVREEPTEGYLLVGFVAAVGLGPGAHNVLLFATVGG